MYDTKMKANTWLDSVPTKVHDEASKAGKFDDGFMTSAEGETPTPKSTQPAGSYPLASESEGSFAKPTHVPGAIKP